MFPYWGNNVLAYILWQAQQQRTGHLLNKQRFWASLPWFLSIKGLTIQPLPRTENFQMLMVSFLLEFFSLGHIWVQGWWSPSWQLCILVSVMDFFYLYQKKKLGCLVDTPQTPAHIYLTWIHFWKDHGVGKLAQQNWKSTADRIGRRVQMMLYLGTQTHTHNESYKINFLLILSTEYVSRRQLFPDTAFFWNAYS